ncbi:hypothetical protein [Rhodococcus kronopolitis]|uniref:Allene oxide cyclase barrel-like domain-containing protein n=1 Tax=Rhodococcus kronopolitis TaxID=1460226 RepID=A0ABV9FM20_9NOCA
MRRTISLAGATLAAVALTLGSAGIASALPVSIPGTTDHAYVAGVDVEPGTYYSRDTGTACQFDLTQAGATEPSSEGVGFNMQYTVVELDAGDRLASVGCTTWHRQGNPFGSAGSTDFGFLGMFGSVDDVFFGYLPLGS